MTVTYDITTSVGQVRLKIGDKTIASPVFTDEELQVFLTANASSINLASAEALESWAASYGANADSEGIGDYRYSQRIIDNMLALAKRLRDAEAGLLGGAPSMDIASMDLTAGSAITAEED